MRDALNSNPLVQAAVIAVLLIGAAVFVLSSTGGTEEEETAGATEATVSVAGTEATGTATGATPGEAVEGAAEAAVEAATAGSATALPLAAGAAPPLPRPVLEAWRANRTVVLLLVHGGGIDDRLAKAATAGVSGFPNASIFVVPARQISRYAAITEGVGVDRVPALVVVTPKPLRDAVVPTASVSYGFQNEESVRQAVIDGGYKGPTIDYHP